MGQVDDEVARLIASGDLTENRGRSSFFRGGIANRLIRQNITGKAGTLSAANRDDPELRARLIENAGRLGQARFMSQFRAKQEALRNAASKRELQKSTGDARLATAQAALRRARGGGRGGEGSASAEALEALGFSPENINKFKGNISPKTARSAAGFREQRVGQQGRKNSLQLRREKEINRQRESNRTNNRANAKQAAANVKTQLAAIKDQLGSIDPVEKDKALALVKQLLDQQNAGGNALPEDQVESYRQAASVQLPKGATPQEIDELAAELARADGFEFAGE